MTEGRSFYLPPENYSPLPIYMYLEMSEEEIMESYEAVRKEMGWSSKEEVNWKREGF